MPDEIDALVPAWTAAGFSPGQIATLEFSKRVARLHNLIESALRTELATLDLTYAEFDVLAALYRRGDPYRLRPSELSRALFLTSGGTSNVLQRLTTAGHLERIADPADGRSRWVRLTPKGRELAVTALAAANRVHEGVMSGIPEGSVRQAADILREVLAAMRR